MEEDEEYSFKKIDVFSQVSLKIAVLFSTIVYSDIILSENFLSTYRGLIYNNSVRSPK